MCSCLFSGGQKKNKTDTPAAILARAPFWLSRPLRLVSCDLTLCASLSWCAMQPNRRSRRAAANAVLEVLVDDRLMATMTPQQEQDYIQTQQRAARAAFERGERGVRCTMDERLAFRRASPFAPASSSNTTPVQIPVSIDPELVKGMTPAQYDIYLQMRTRQALADPDRARRDYEIDMSFGMGAATPTPTPAPAPSPTATPAPTPAPKMSEEPAEKADSEEESEQTDSEEDDGFAG